MGDSAIEENKLLFSCQEVPSSQFAFIPKYIIDLEIAREKEKEDIKKVEAIIAHSTDSQALYS